MRQKGQFSTVVVSVLIGVCVFPINCFVSRSLKRQWLHAPQKHDILQPLINLAPRIATSLQASLWDRLQIEEDDEPHWYLLNCIAGLELDLLRQCRDRCGDMEGVVKFVVPMESLTRSHGANRMLTEHMTKYQGYVFANLRLDAETYNAIQELDLCRSWMGNVNYKGSKKLPPAPIALSEVEIAEFGLENIQEGNEGGDDDVIDDTEIILDTAEQDMKDKKPKVNADQLKEFLGLKVEDMVKVTATNKFYGEDGIIKRLKGGKIMVQFFTYGTTYSEWLKPNELRKLGEDEILRGLSGPSKPITQQDFDADGEGDRYANQGDMRGASGRNVRTNTFDSSSGSRGDRNRREDRVERGDKFKRDMFNRNNDEENREERNWKEYQDRQLVDIPNGGDAGRNSRVENQSNQGVNQANVDGQWGRFPDRNLRKERAQVTPRNMQENKKVSNAIYGADDWSAFVSPVPPTSPVSTTKEDDFFASLMNELSGDVDKKPSNKISQSNKDDDDFFASLMNELKTEGLENKPSKQQQDVKGIQNKDVVVKQENDFFASLEAELGNVDTLGSLGRMDGDDFFTKLEAEMTVEQSRPAKNSGQDSGSNDDFFAALERAMAVPIQPPKTNIGNNNRFDDFELGAIFDSSDSGTSFVQETKEKPAKASPVAASYPPMDRKSKASLDSPSKFLREIESPLPTTPFSTSENDSESKASQMTPSNSLSPSSDLEKCTVPVLKSMLKGRGLKITGKKSELIERLQGVS